MWNCSLGENSNLSVHVDTNATHICLVLGHALYVTMPMELFRCEKSMTLTGRGLPSACCSISVRKCCIRNGFLAAKQYSESVHIKGMGNVVHFALLLYSTNSPDFVQSNTILICNYRPYCKTADYSLAIMNLNHSNRPAWL